MESIKKNVDINKKKRFINGWVILIACMVVQAIPFSVASNIQPQFISYVMQGNGFSLARLSAMFTIGTLASAIFSPIIGSIYKKVNAKIFFLIGCIISGCGFFLFSMANTIGEFYILQAVVQIGTEIFSSIGIPLLINSWFPEAMSGEALSLAFAGGSIGNIFLQDFVVSSLVHQGYKKSYMIFGTLSLVVGIVITLLILRFPKNKDEMVEVKGSFKKRAVKKVVSEKNYSIKELKSMKSFWLFAIGYIFIGLSIAALSIQYPAYYRELLGTDPNFSSIAPTFVGIIGSMFAFFSLVGNLLGGVVFDKLGVIKSLIIAFFLSVLACLFLIFSKYIPSLAYLFAITKGLSVYCYMMGPAYLTRRLFGNENYGTILGITNLVFAVGFAAGSTFFGLAVDSLGYVVAWGSVLVFTIIAFILLIISCRNIMKKNNEVAVLK